MRVSITKSRSGHYTVSAKEWGFSAKRGKLSSLRAARALKGEVIAEVEEKLRAHEARQGSAFGG